MNVRFGIIGLGRISNRFAKVLKTAKGVELTAVASREQARSDEFARKYGAKRAYASYEELINDPEVDLIYDGLTHNFHYDLTKQCLESHKAVLCEKPFVTNQKDALELVALAKEKSTFLMEAMWTRCMPVYQQAKTWVKEGKIGDVKLIMADFNYKTAYDPENRLFNPKLAGGSLFDVGVYPLEFATGILAETPLAASGSALLSPSGVDAAAAFSLRFPRGALASLTCGFNVNTPNTAAIYGTEGSIKLDSSYTPRLAELFNEKGKRLARFQQSVADGFIYQIEHSAKCFSEGKLESDLIPWADTVACAGIFDDLRKQWGLI
jgi:Predicted dehydrogenases and related proteins